MQLFQYSASSEVYYSLIRHNSFRVEGSCRRTSVLGRGSRKQQSGVRYGAKLFATSVKYSFNGLGKATALVWSYPVCTMLLCVPDTLLHYKQSKASRWRLPHLSQNAGWSNGVWLLAGALATNTINCRLHKNIQWQVWKHPHYYMHTLCIKKSPICLHSEYCLSIDRIHIWFRNVLLVIFFFLVFYLLLKCMSHWNYSTATKRYTKPLNTHM